MVHRSRGPCSAGAREGQAYGRARGSGAHALPCAVRAVGIEGTAEDRSLGRTLREGGKGAVGPSSPQAPCDSVKVRRSLVASLLADDAQPPRPREAALSHTPDHRSLAHARRSGREEHLRVALHGHLQGCTWEFASLLVSESLP